MTTESTYNALLKAFKDAALTLRRRIHLREIDAVATKHAQRYAIVPLLAEEPVGVERLRALAIWRVS